MISTLGSIGIAACGVTLAILARNVPVETTEPRHPITSLMLTEAEQKATKPAPEFAVPDDRGKVQTLASFSKNGPVFMLFILDGCPCSIEAQPVFSDLWRAYGQRVQFVGVSNSTVPKAALLRKDLEVPFPVLADQKLDIMRSYGGQRSVYSALIVEGKVVKLWPGYNRAMVGEINDKLARLAGTWPKSVNFTGVPEKPTSGCSFFGN